jgi:hypothetical protein
MSTQTAARSPLAVRDFRLMMFSSLALTPISMAAAGAMVTISLEGTFAVAGLGMASLTLLALLSANHRRMGLEPTIEPEDAPPGAPNTAAVAAAG